MKRICYLKLNKHIKANEIFLNKGSGYKGMNEKGRVRFEDNIFQDSNKKKQNLVRQKSLNRTMSTSALRIRKRRSFWSKETLKIGA